MPVFDRKDKWHENEAIKVNGVKKRRVKDKIKNGRTREGKTIPIIYI